METMRKNIKEILNLMDDFLFLEIVFYLKKIVFI
jgi:hypothetical protein